VKDLAVKIEILINEALVARAAAEYLASEIRAAVVARGALRARGQRRANAVGHVSSVGQAGCSLAKAANRSGG
jgi:hypothetical protein